MPTMWSVGHSSQLDACSFVSTSRATTTATWFSKLVSHPCTNQALPCLASEIWPDQAYLGQGGKAKGAFTLACIVRDFRTFLESSNLIDKCETSPGPWSGPKTESLVRSQEVVSVLTKVRWCAVWNVFFGKFGLSDLITRRGGVTITSPVRKQQSLAPFSLHGRFPPTWFKLIN